MTTFLVLAAGMVLGEAKASAETAAYCRESIAEALADSLRFEPSPFAERDPGAEEAFMAFAREAALESARRILPDDEVLDLEYAPAWLGMHPVSFGYTDTVLAAHQIEVRCFELLHALMRIRLSMDPSVQMDEGMRIFGVSRETSEVPSFVDAYFDYVLNALREIAGPFDDNEGFQRQLDMARAWVAASLDSPLPEDAHTRLTTDDFDRVVNEMRRSVERSHAAAWNPEIEPENFEERAATQFRDSAHFLARQYIELAWEAGFVTFLPREVIELRVMDLSDDPEQSRRGQKLYLREMVESERLNDELRQQAREQLERLEERPY